MYRGIVVKNVIYQIVGRFVTASIGLATTALATRALGVVDFGAFNFVLTAVYFAYLIPDYGLQSLVVREVAQSKDPKIIVSRMLMLRLILGTAVTVILLATVWLLPYSLPVKLALVFAAFGQKATLYTSLFWGVLQGKLRFGRIVLAQTAMVSLQLLLSYVGAVNQQGLLYFACVYLATVSFGLVGTWVLTKKFIGSISWRVDSSKLLKLVSSAMPFAFGLIFSVAYLRVDTLILAYFFNPSLSPDVGLYAIAFKPFEIITILGGFVAQALYPIFSQHIRKHSIIVEFRTYGAIVVVFGMLGAVAQYVSAEWVVKVIGGSQFYSAVTPLRILSLATFVTVVSGFTVAIALAGKREKELMYVSAFALFLNVVLNLIFVPSGSYMAASWVTVLTQTVILVGNIWAVLLVMRGLDTISSQRKKQS